MIYSIETYYKPKRCILQAPLTAESEWRESKAWSPSIVTPGSLVQFSRNLAADPFVVEGSQVVMKTVVLFRSCCMRVVGML